MNKNKIMLELSPNQVEELVEKLDLQEKMQLVQRLEKETRRARWGTILKDIDARLKKFPTSEEEITKEIEAYRKEKYAKGRS